jgi:hypothetical protein
MKKLYILIILLTSVLLTFVSFKGIRGNEFIFIHDEAFFLTKNEAINSLFLRNSADLGTSNTTSLIVTIYDRLFYFTAYQLNLNVLTAQISFYFIKIFILLFFSYLGFRKMREVFDPGISDLAAFIVSMWYVFNTFTLIYWNTNSFTTSSLICYALAPLAFYYFHKYVIEGTDKKSGIKLILLLFLMSFTLYFFPVFIIITSLYTLLYAVFKKVPVFPLIKRVIVLLVMYLPLFSIHLFIPYEILVNHSSSVNESGGATYGMLKGELLYPLLMWFSWGIYTYWTPRNILSFYQYYKTILSITAPFVLYFLILLGFIKRIKNTYLYIFFIIFLILIFFIKGAQPPLGDIYLYLLDHVAIFRVFRSPDSKFGFGIVLTVALLLLIASTWTRKRIFVSLVVLVALVQGFYMFTGEAIKGQQTKTTSDRIIRITKDYKEISDFFNNGAYEYGYILPNPADTFASFNLGEGESHLGQDLLPKIIDFPFVNASEYSGMSTNTYKKLTSIFQKDVDLTHLSAYPIKYF